MKLTTLKPSISVLDTRIAHPAKKSFDKHYSDPQHRSWSASVIARAGGRCEWVEGGNRCTKARPLYRMYADHIVELQDGGEEFELSNGQCLCAEHHTLKTNKERVKRTATPV